MLTDDQLRFIDKTEPHQLMPKGLRRIDKTLTDEVLADAIIDGEVVGVRADYLREGLSSGVVGQRRTERLLERISLQLKEIGQTLGSLSRGDLAQRRGDCPARPRCPVGRGARLLMKKAKARMLLTSKPLTKSALLRLKREHVRTWTEVVRPIKEAIRRSEQVTDKDLAIRINARS